MVSWFYAKSDLKATPSLLDGVAYDVEMAFRKEGARFIMDLGNKIGLRYDSVATGVIFLHRFYMFHSFKEFDRYVTACCCLFLAGKVEETPKKCKDIIKMAKSLLSETKFAAFGVDPKEEVMTMERILLQTIKFDLQVEHPYTYLIKYAKCLKGDKMKLHKCVQMAWTFVNDSLCTTLSLQWEPEIIAIALMYLAGKLSKFEVVDWVGRHPHHMRWWDMFVQDMSMELLEDVCHQVLDLYTQTNRPRPDSSSMPSVFKQQISGEHNKSTAEVGGGGTPTKKDSAKRKSSVVNTPPAPSNKLSKQDQTTAPAAASSSTPSSSAGPVTAAGPAVHSPSLQQQQLPSGFQYGSAPPISAAVGTAAGYGFPSYGAVSSGGMSASVTAVAPPLPGTPGGTAGKYPGQQQQLMAQQQPPYVAYGYPPSAVGDSNTAGMPPLPPPPSGKFTALPPHALGGHPPPHPPYPPAAGSRPPPRGYFGPPPGFGPPGGGYQPPRRPF